MKWLTRVQILEKADCVSYHSNEYWKGMNNSLLSQTMNE